MTKRILLSALLCVPLYLGSYVFLRLQGSLLIDPSRDSLFRVADGDPDRGVMYSPVLSLYRAAESLENLLPAKIDLGTSQYGVRYGGDYPPDDAERMVKGILGKVPEEASGFRGEYDCAFYDDQIVQSIQFDLDRAVWERWRGALIDAMKAFRRAETVVEKAGGIRADYGSSAGYLDVTFAESTVTLVRQVHD